MESATREEKPLKGANPTSAIELKYARDVPERIRRREVGKTCGRSEVRVRQGRTISFGFFTEIEGVMAIVLRYRCKLILGTKPRSFPVLEAL